MSHPDPVASSRRDAMSTHFGVRLKYWRRTRSLTQADLARALDVDGSYISKIESSQRHPNPDMAKRCDDILDTGGELAGLLALLSPGPVTETRPAAPVPAAVPIPASWPPPPQPVPDLLPTRPTPGSHTTATLLRLLEAYTEIDCSMGGSQISASVEQQARDIVSMHVGTSTTMTASLLRLAGRYARLAGLIRMDCLDHNGSRFWLDCGQRWAIAGGDLTLAAELLARQSIVQSGFGDPAGGLALATVVETLGDDLPHSARVWALLAESRARSVAGDAMSVTDRIDRADKLLTGIDGPLLASPAHQSTDVVWNTMVAICHLNLAEAGTAPDSHAPRAIAMLRTALTALPTQHIRDIAMSRLRLVRAHHVLGDRDAAQSEFEQAHALAQRCSSPRLRSAVQTVHDRLDPHRTVALTMD